MPPPTLPERELPKHKLPIRLSTCRYNGPAANCTQPGGGKHVPSRMPITGVGPSDAHDQVNRHKGVNSGPTTAGRNPNRPARRLASENNSLTSGTPAAGSAPAAFPPCEGNY
jgi:hypothetical protein